MKKKIKALSLFSGGLDSILAVKVLEKQGIDVAALTFVSHFFNDEKVRISAKENGIKLKSIDISKVHLEIVKNPKHGRGGAMNPCIDCHALMIKEAGRIMEKEGYDFVATGEVLGQRPMSQNSQALGIVEKEAGLEGRLLRPLSAKLMDETLVEKDGLVDRERLLDISGRSRKRQLDLANKLGVRYFPTPAGGCILTEKEFGKKLKDLLENTDKQRPSDLELLKLGRHFWSGKTNIILGRNEEENKLIEKLSEAGDILLELEKIPGPLALVRGRITKKSLDEAKKLIIRYARQARGKDVEKLRFLSDKI